MQTKVLASIQKLDIAKFRKLAIVKFWDILFFEEDPIPLNYFNRKDAFTH